MGVRIFPGRPLAGLARALCCDGQVAHEFRGINPLNDSTVYDFTGTVTGKIGEVTMKWITAYRDIDFEGASDLDGTPIPMADVGIFTLKGHQITQEIQFLGTGLDDRLNWVTGAYYFREQIRNAPISRTPAAIQNNMINPDNESMSLFAQLTFEIVPNLRLTGGGRYVHDVRKMVYTPTRATVAAAFANVAVPRLPRSRRRPVPLPRSG